MRYYKFVKWDVNPVESQYNNKVVAAMIAHDNGDKNAIKKIYHEYAISMENLNTGLYKRGGWAFILRDYCRRYWVKTRYYGIQEYFAPNKTCIYNIIGRYNAVECVEVCKV